MRWLLGPSNFMCINRMNKAKALESKMKESLKKKTEGAQKALTALRGKLPSLPVSHLKIAGERVKILGKANDESDEIILERDYLQFTKDDITREKTRDLLKQIFSKSKPVRIFGCDSTSATLVKRALLYRYNTLTNLTKNELAARGDDVSVREKIHHLNQLKKIIDTVTDYCSPLGAPPVVREVTIEDGFQIDDEEKIKTLIRKFARLIILSATSQTEKQQSLSVIKAVDSKKDFSAQELQGLQTINLEKFDIVDALTALGVHGKFGAIKSLFETIVAAIQESPIYEESSEFNARLDAIVLANDLAPPQKVNEVIGLLLNKYKNTRDLLLSVNEQARELQRALEEKVIALKKANEELQAATEKLSSIEAKHAEEKGRLESELSEAKAGFDSAKKDYERAQKEIEDLQAQLQSSTSQASAAKASLAEMKTLSETLQANVARLQNENTAQAAKISELEKALATCEEKLAALGKEKETATVALAAATEKVKQFESDATLTEKGMAEKAATLAGAQTALAAANQKLTEVNAALEKTRAEKEALNQELIKATESISSLGIEVKKGQEKQAELEGTVGSLQESVKAKDGEIKSLQQKLEDETKRLRQEALAEIQVQKEETKKALGIVTTLQGQIGEKDVQIRKTTEEYEQKIATITSDFTQKVESERQKAAASLTALQTQQEAEISKLKTDSALLEKRLVAEREAIVKQMEKDLSEGSKEQMTAAVERAKAEATDKLAALQKLFDEQKTLLTKAQEEKRAAEVAAAAALAAKIKEMTTERENAIAKIKQEKEAEFAQKILETKQAYEKELATLRSSGASEKEAAITDLQTKHTAELTRIQKEADAKKVEAVDTIRREYERMIAVIQESHKKKLDEEAQKRTDNLGVELAKQRATLEATFKTQMTDAIQKKEVEFASQKKTIEGELATLKTERNTLKSQITSKNSETAARIQQLTSQIAAKETERAAAVETQTRERSEQAKKIQQFAARVLAGQLNSTPYPGEENKPLRDILEKMGDIQKAPSMSKEVCTLILFVNYYINTIFRTNFSLGQKVYESLSASIIACVGRLNKEGKIKASDDPIREGLFRLICIFDDILFSAEKLITSYGTDVADTGIFLQNKDKEELEDFKIIWNLLKDMNVNSKDCFDLMKRRIFGSTFTDIPIYPPLQIGSPQFTNNIIIVYEPNSATLGQPYSSTQDSWRRLLRFKRFEKGFLPTTFSALEAIDIPKLITLTASRPITYEVLFVSFIVACQLYVSRLDLKNTNCYLPEEVRNPMTGLTAHVTAPQSAFPPMAPAVQAQARSPSPAPAAAQAQARSPSPAPAPAATQAPAQAPAPAVAPPQVPQLTRGASVGSVGSSATQGAKVCVMRTDYKETDDSNPNGSIYFNPTSTNITVFRNYPYCMNVQKGRRYDLQSIWSYIQTIHNQPEFKKLAAPPGFAKDAGTGKITLLDKYSKKIVIGGSQTKKNRKGKSTKKTRKQK